MSESEWTEKGKTFSDKTACKEFGITEEEVYEAIKHGALQYRRTTLYGNPCLRLLRVEVEKFVKEKYGANHLEIRKLKTELKKVNSRTNSIKRELSSLSKRKIELQNKIDGLE
jgi:hypothetical protein